MHGVIYGRILPMTGIGFPGAPVCRVRETHASYQPDCLRRKISAFPGDSGGSPKNSKNE